MQRTTGPATDSSPANLSSPDGLGARFRAALTSKVQYFQEDVNALQSHVMEGQWGEPELQELRDMCEQLKAQNGNLKQELLQIQRLESGRDPESFENESKENHKNRKVLPCYFIYLQGQRCPSPEMFV